jgi:predicted DNA-binding antitoxin AbrB/MazE fold protein
MAAIRAIFENGVFRPTEPVSLPERCEVEFEPRIRQQEPTTGTNGKVAKIYEILDERFESGHTNTAERHNEHQP